MEEKNENENSNILINTALIIIKIALVILFILFVHHIYLKIQNNIPKGKEAGQNVKTNLDKNKIETKDNDNNVVSLNNSLIKSENNNSEANNNNLISFQNLITYDNIIFNSFDIFKAVKKMYFSLLDMNYTFSEEFNMVKLEYIMGFYDENKSLLIPSDMTLVNDLHFAFFLELSKKKIVNSLAYIYLGKYIKCTEIFKYGEKIKFGVAIFRRISHFKIYFYTKEVINYADLSNENDDIFNPKVVNYKFNSMVNEIKTDKLDRPFSLKKAYFRRPLFELRRNYVRNNSDWLFRNFYDEYFCYCIGANCLREPFYQSCKYLYYIVIIDRERYLYPKTDFIFVDFIFKNLASDDTYPVFEEMMRENYPAHYITEKEDIMEKYCQNDPHCQTIIPININTYFTYGDFFEKYLTLVLKTKAFVSGKEKHFHRVGYLFYRIEYVTYIGVGHGVCYFKDYLFDKNRIYGNKRNNKILIPPSKILVATAKKHGWKDKDIIKLNLPRWDRYNKPIGQDKITDAFSGNITSNSILVMFTWRMNKKYWNYEISPYYIENMTKLIQNEVLRKELESNNITLYVSFHRYVRDANQQTIIDILENNKNIKVIEQNDISECLAKTNLVVTDFSSIIFDLMYREKPFVIYVPDSNDPNITDVYTDDYIQLIDRMNNGTFKTANKCNSVEETVNKIIYYIKNKFEIDDNLKKYFKYFNFIKGNNIGKFIKYLLSLE